MSFFKKKKPDFAGYVTKNDILCSDGVVIKQSAFKDLIDGLKVPMVWQHNYSEPGNVIGTMELELRHDGVYGYGYLNDTRRGRDSKILIKHGDINSLSIGARGIKKEGNNVVHGEIYEVSLVLKGANPGAKIEHVMTHSGDASESYIIHTGIGINQSEEDTIMNKTIGDVLIHMDDETSRVVDKFLTEGPDSLTEEEIEIINELSDDEVVATAAIMETMDELDEDDADFEDDSDYEDFEDEDDFEDDADYEDDIEDEDITQSIFDLEEETLKHSAYTGSFGGNHNTGLLTHADADIIVKNALENRSSSLKADFMGTVMTHGIQDEDILQHGLLNIDILFPAAESNKRINIYNPGQQAVEKMMGKFGRSPLSKVKTLFMDISEEDARARGYIKGNEKLDSIEKLLYRETTPHTVIRRTKIDRDDIIDIKENGIDVVAYLKQVQQIKFKEEIVRAAILGDGRKPRLDNGDRNPDKINEDHIRPICKEPDLFTIKVTSANWKTVVDDVIGQMAAYQGSGSPALIINPFDLAKLKTLKDGDGRYLYAPSGASRVPTDNDIAAYFACSEVIPYNIMPQGQFLIGNLADYVFGAARGGEVATFEEFDMDFNQEKYLMEARMSGSIQAPKSFIFVKVTEIDAKDESAIKFNKEGLKEHPSWGTDSTKDPKDLAPGKKYASKHSEPDPAG